MQGMRTNVEGMRWNVCVHVASRLICDFFFRRYVKKLEPPWLDRATRSPPWIVGSALRDYFISSLSYLMWCGRWSPHVDSLWKLQILRGSSWFHLHFTAHIVSRYRSVMCATCNRNERIDSFLKREARALMRKNLWLIRVIHNMAECIITPASLRKYLSGFVNTFQNSRVLG